jgi:hypothetical protein
MYIVEKIRFNLRNPWHYFLTVSPIIFVILFIFFIWAAVPPSVPAFFSSDLFIFSRTLVKGKKELHSGRAAASVLK